MTATTSRATPSVSAMTSPSSSACATMPGRSTASSSVAHVSAGQRPSDGRCGAVGLRVRAPADDDLTRPAGHRQACGATRSRRARPERTPARDAGQQSLEQLVGGSSDLGRDRRSQSQPDQRTDRGQRRQRRSRHRHAARRAVAVAAWLRTSCAIHPAPAESRGEHDAPRCAAARSANSASSRLTPTPGAPTTVDHVAGRRRSHPRRRASSSSSLLSADERCGPWRIELEWRSATPICAVDDRGARDGDRLGKPFSVRLGKRLPAAVRAGPRRRWRAGEDLAGSAAAHSRAARLTAAPYQSPLSKMASPADTPTLNRTSRPQFPAGEPADHRAASAHRSASASSAPEGKTTISPSPELLMTSPRQSLSRPVQHLEQIPADLLRQRVTEPGQQRRRSDLVAEQHP